ncbi:MAG: hypothetical protein J6V72_06305 [Kiritimatiellae bacterium]|nr:hypothetical protein [Kiritimatiellia bacterium]
MKIQFLVAAALTASIPLFAQEAAPAAPAAPAAAEAASQPTAIAPETVAEVNKAVTTHVKTTAKSIVGKDIDEYCKEMGITIGAVTPTDAIYLKGVERVTERAASPNFTRSRTMAYEKAYQKAVASYVMDKFGSEAVRQFNTYFADNSSNRLSPTTDSKTTLERIEEKTAQLTEAKLDEGLRAMGVTPTGSVAEKRKLAEDSLIKSSIRNAVGSSAGLLPVQTFEGWNEGGQYAVGVVIRGGAETETIAECLRYKMRPSLVRPDAGRPVSEVLPTDDELVSQFGVRLFFDKDGVPALLSFAQWGSAYTGTDEDAAEDALDHALVQAEALANEQLTVFINSTITVKESSDKGESKSTTVTFDANGVPTEQKVVDYIDKAMKSSAIQGQDTLIGRSTVLKKVLVHPSSGQKLAVCVRMWSFGQYDAMKRIIEKPKPQVVVPPVPAPQPTGTSGKRRGRSYDF